MSTGALPAGLPRCTESAKRLSGRAPVAGFLQGKEGLWKKKSNLKEPSTAPSLLASSHSSARLLAASEYWVEKQRRGERGG